jgi:hypothetical protein
VEHVKWHNADDYVHTTSTQRWESNMWSNTHSYTYIENEEEISHINVNIIHPALMAGSVLSLANRRRARPKVLVLTLQPNSRCCSGNLQVGEPKAWTSNIFLNTAYSILYNQKFHNFPLIPSLTDRLMPLHQHHLLVISVNGDPEFPLNQRIANT